MQGQPLLCFKMQLRRNIPSCLTAAHWYNCLQWAPWAGKCHSWVQSLSEMRGFKVEDLSCHSKKLEVYFLLPQLFLFCILWLHHEKSSSGPINQSFPVSYKVEVILPPVCSLALSPAWCSSHQRVERNHSLVSLASSQEGGHVGTRVTVWPRERSASIATSFSSYHDGEDQIRTSLWLWVSLLTVTSLN